MAEKKTIFIIDDDKFLLDMYSLKFTDSGFDVSAFSDATEALQKIVDGAKPQIILLDIMMPVMDGFGFMEELKKQNLAKSSVVIFLSNLGQKEDIEKGMQSGARGYIIKASSTPTEVVEKVKQITSENKTQ
ncbi:MAG: response regulator [Candidatus Vogelbacteria bacterium]|nr:response regulator [Candidatus Vogelbacteria bacterium]